MDDNHRIAAQHAREMETARPQGTDEAVQGRMARLDVSQEFARYLLDFPRNEDMGARNGPQGTQAAPQLIRSAAGALPSPAGYGRVSGARTGAVVEEGARKED